MLCIYFLFDRNASFHRLQAVDGPLETLEVDIPGCAGLLWSIGRCHEPRDINYLRIIMLHNRRVARQHVDVVHGQQLLSETISMNDSVVAA